MAKSLKAPTYRKKTAGNVDYAIVTLTDVTTGQRKDVMLGHYRTLASRQKYAQVIAEWSNNQGHLAISTNNLTVAEMILLYTTREILPTNNTKEISKNQSTMKILKKMYGTTRAIDFGPNALRVVRESMVGGDRKAKPPREPWCRRFATQQSRRIINMYKWAAAHEIMPVTSYQKLATIEPLKRGEGKESKIIKPASLEHIQATKKHLPTTIQAIIDLQLQTGMRPTEALTMTMADINQSKSVWLYQPADHKNAHRGKARNIYLSSKAQAIIKQHAANKADDQPIFSPRDAMAEIHAAAKCHRRPNQKPNNRVTDRVIRDHYDADSYRRAIYRASSKAGVPRWTPYQLRHNYATEIRKLHGLEAAQIMLGHSSAVITDAVYAERDENKAIKIAKGEQAS